MATTSETNWQIETLFKKAFERTKERFLSYFLAMVMMWGGFLVTILVFGIIGTILGFATYATHNMVLFGVVITVVVLAFLLAIFYIAGWWGLAVTEIMIQSNKTDVIGAFKKVRPLIWSYLGTQGILGLLVFGLLPFIVLSLGVVAILWSFWGSFVLFSYLEREKRGAEALWYSRDLFNQKFWAVAGRMIILTAVLIGLQAVLGLAHSNALRVVGWLISLVSTPFVIGYNYEIFKNLDPAVKEHKPTGWIIASVIGGVISLVLLVSLTIGAVQNLPNMMKENQFTPPTHSPLRKPNSNQI